MEYDATWLFEGRIEDGSHLPICINGEAWWTSLFAMLLLHVSEDKGRVPNCPSCPDAASQVGQSTTRPLFCP